MLRITSVPAVGLVRSRAQCFHLELGVRAQKVHLFISSLKLAQALKLGSLTKNKQTSKKPQVNIQTLTYWKICLMLKVSFPFVSRVDSFTLFFLACPGVSFNMDVIYSDRPRPLSISRWSPQPAGPFSDQHHGLLVWSLHWE